MILRIAANGSGLRLVSYYVLGSNHQPPPDSRCRSALADGLTPTANPEGKIKESRIMF